MTLAQLSVFTDRTVLSAADYRPPFTPLNGMVICASRIAEMNILSSGTGPTAHAAKQVCSCILHLCMQETRQEELREALCMPIACCETVHALQPALL